MSTESSLLTIRMANCTASELLNSLGKDTTEEGSSLLNLATQGLNLLHNGRNGKVRLENQYAYFDADFLDNKVWVNIRLKQEFWHTVVNLKQLYEKLKEMGYNDLNKIENVLFDNRIYIFIPYRKSPIEVPKPTKMISETS